MIISASNAKIGLVETSLAIIPGGGKLLSDVCDRFSNETEDKLELEHNMQTQKA